MEKNIPTNAELEKLEKELYDLKVIKKREIAERLIEAREKGDLSENTEYDAVKDEQRKLETRISEIEQIIMEAKIVPL